MSVAINNVRTNRFSYHLGNAEASRTNFVAVRRGALANATMVDDMRTSTTFYRPSYDNVLDNDSRHRPRSRKSAIVPDEVSRSASFPLVEGSWVLEAPRLELLGSDHPGGGAVDRSSDDGVAARASSRTR